MENTDYKNIKGWNVDADPENEPTYPMKKYTGDDHQRINWERPVTQPVNEEILKSNEHARMPAVFGASVPPSGLSGKIRRFAFKFSEGNWGHWLSLILADRINMMEGLADDLKNGYVPNIFAERGWKAEFKHNPKGVAKNIAVGVLVVSAVAGLIYYKTRKSKKALI